jgi:spore coat polysaccharide biosynthesis protein SpsF (cytidylyltransferase family)
VAAADVVVCATVDHPDCDPIAAEAARLGVHVFRGDEMDVVQRYLGAAGSVGADSVMRVTSDCPLIDPAVCDAVLRLFAERGVDYACNNMPPSWPHGLDCEAFSVAALRRADECMTDPVDREYPTRKMRSDPDWTRVSLLGPGGDWERMRLTLDTPADFAFFQAFIPRLPDADRASTAEVATVLRRDPSLAAMLEGVELHHGLRREAPTVPYTELLPAF